MSLDGLQFASDADALARRQCIPEKILGLGKLATRLARVALPGRRGQNANLFQLVLLRQSQQPYRSSHGRRNDFRIRSVLDGKRELDQVSLSNGAGGEGSCRGQVGD
jgi:hypothetical protein